MIGAATLQLANSAAVQNGTVAINIDNGLQFIPGIGTFCLGGLSGSNLLQLSDTAGGAVALAVGSDGASTTFGGAISGAGSLTKTGAGTLVLSGTDSYSGGTTVDAGTLVLSRSDDYGGGTTVNAGMLVATNSNAIPYGSLTVGGGGTFVFDPSASAGPSTASQIAALPSVAVAAVPEPGTIALLAAALWSAAIYRRFRRPHIAG